ncbi:IS110 family transposase [Burkholderia sp. Ax-1724]|uniref:IS110 family transposase n=1 Tax=Burkholderia sp. Ax-1724 TaxID=2608336 RepID=UPI001F04C506|nr:IS110 family transposase [Burkholderia sp. Ax-1724]
MPRLPVISETGKLLGTLSVTDDTARYLKLQTRENSLGHPHRAGVEGTGTYGTCLARVLRDHKIEVPESNHPDRATRHSRGKSDPTDAGNAARAFLARTDSGTP